MKTKYPYFSFARQFENKNQLKWYVAELMREWREGMPDEIEYSY